MPSWLPIAILVASWAALGITFSVIDEDHPAHLPMTYVSMVWGLVVVAGLFYAMG